MLTLWPVDVTGLSLEGLVVALGATLAVLVVTFVGMIVTAMVLVVVTNVGMIVTVMVVVVAKKCISFCNFDDANGFAHGDDRRVCSADLRDWESCRYSASPFCGGVCVWCETQSASHAS